MVVTEFYRTRDDGVNLYRTHSDEGLVIQKEGTDEKYDEAIDIEGAGHTYVETDEPILTREQMLAEAQKSMRGTVTEE